MPLDVQPCLVAQEATGEYCNTTFISYNFAAELAYSTPIPHSTSIEFDFNKHHDQEPIANIIASPTAQLETNSSPQDEPDSWGDYLANFWEELGPFAIKLATASVTTVVAVKFPLVMLGSIIYVSLIKTAKEASSVESKEALSSYAIEIFGSTITSSFYKPYVGIASELFPKLAYSDNHKAFTYGANFLREAFIKTSAFTFFALIEYSITDTVNTAVELINFSANKVQALFDDGHHPSQIIQKIPNNINPTRFKSIFFKKTSNIIFTDLGLKESQSYASSSFVKNALLTPGTFKSLEEFNVAISTSYVATATSSVSKLAYEEIFWQITGKTIENIACDDPLIIAFALIKGTRAFAKYYSKVYFDQSIQNSSPSNNDYVYSTYGPFWPQEGYYPGYGALTSDLYLLVNISNPGSPFNLDGFKYLPNNDPVLTEVQDLFGLYDDAQKQLQMPSTKDKPSF